MASRTSHRTLSVRTAVGAAAGALVLGVLPGLWSPAAAATPVDVDQALDELRQAASTGLTAIRAGGGRVVSTTSFSFGSETFSSTSTVVADAAHRTMLVTAASPDGPDGLPTTAGDPCDPRRSVDPASARLLLAEGTGTLAALPATREARQGRRLVGRPKARWVLEQRSGATFATMVGAVDALSRELDYVAEYRLDGATAAAVADGTRYTLEFTDESVGSDGTLVVDVLTNGRPARTATTETLDGITFSSRGVYVYGPQTVPVPTSAQVVAKKRLAQGCRAAFTRLYTKAAAREVARRLNREPGRVRVARLRLTTTRVLRTGTDVRVDVRDDRVAGGAVITGRHRLLGRPVRRYVVVKDGRAVVRKRPPATRG